MHEIIRHGEKFDRFDSTDELVDRMISLTNARIGEAMRSVPRELFIDGRQRTFVLDDRAIFVPGYRGESSVSQPSVVARMTKLLDPQHSETVLEIGTASGYQSAILSRLAMRVVSVDVLPKLVRKAKKRHTAMGITNVNVLIADGSRQFAKAESFDKIIVTAALTPDPFHELFDLLKEEGKIVAPIGGIEGDPTACDLVVLHKQNGFIIEDQRISGYSFVPMGGQRGWEFFMRYVIRVHSAMFTQILKKNVERLAVSTQPVPVSDGNNR